MSVPEDLVSDLGDRMYRTGDWGYILADSILEICGRCDTMVKIRGYSIEILVQIHLAFHRQQLIMCSVQNCNAISNKQEELNFAI